MPWPFRLLLWLTPRDFRRGFGDEVLACARDRRAALGPVTRTQAWRFWRREAMAIIRANWWSGRRPHPVSMSPEPRPAPWETLLRDLRVAGRGLWRRPTFTLVAVLTLGVGFGATTAVFSVAYGVLARPMPYPDAGRLVVLEDATRRWGLTEPELFYLQDRATTLEPLAAYVSYAVNVTGEHDPLRVTATGVTANLFATLGVGPALGRGFRDADEGPSAPPVVVMSARLWRVAYGADPRIVGRDIYVNERPFAVVGVMPDGFAFPTGVQTELWFPAGFDRSSPSLGNRYLSAVGRLAPGGDLAAARLEANRLNDAFRAEYTERYGNRFNSTTALHVSTLRDLIVGPVRGQLWMLVAAVCCVLLIAGVNVASLTISRSEDRAHELAVRVALGAGRGRLASAILAESLLVSVLGGVCGVALALVVLDVLRRHAPSDVPFLDAVALDAPVVLLIVGVIVLVGLGVGAVPAALASRVRAPRGAASVPRAVVGERSTRWLRQSLVVGELALAVALVAGAGLLIRSLDRLQRVDMGFEPSGLLTFQVSPAARTYPTPGEVARFYDRFEDALAGLPGVASVGAVTLLPLSGQNSNTSLRIEGYVPAEGETTGADYRIVTEGYVRALGATIVAGRAFARSDDSAAPAVALVNQAAARRYWAARTPVGGRVQLNDDTPWHTVVGVINDVRAGALHADARPMIYFSRRQSYVHPALGSWRRMTVVVRAAGDALDLVAGVRERLGEIDPNLPVANVETMRSVVGRHLGRRRFITTLLSVFAGVGIFLATIGVYGVMSHYVGQRTREVGIRVALGASPGRVGRLVLAQALGLVVAGLALGTAASLGLARLLSGLLYEVPPGDPVTLGAVLTLLATAGLGAAYLPARRAERIDPMWALRQ